MPTMAFFIKAISVVLEYGMLFWLLYFVSRSIRYMWKDMKKRGGELSRRGGVAGEAILTVVDSRDGQQMGRRFSLSEEIAIGRGPDNDIVVSDNFVSHHHAVVFHRNNLYVIEDLGSRNHTYVNDRQLKGKAYLRPGDLIRIGFLTMRFDNAPGEAIYDRR